MCDWKELKTLHEFKRHYSPDQAIWWYTKESCLYRMMNQALRKQDINLLFLFRFFIQDIYEQLQQQRCLDFLRVYRGQGIPVKELERLRTSVGQLISFNSFISTSRKKDAAEKFLPGSNDLERVFWEIEADLALSSKRPAADISQISAIKEEAEILFMLGSIFRVQSIYRSNSDNCWIVKLTLCTDDNEQVKDIIDNMRGQYGDADDETDLLVLGYILRSAGQLENAEKYFRILLKALPRNDENIGKCYFNLAVIASDKGKDKSSIRWYEKWQKFIKRRYQECDIISGDFYYSKAVVDQKKRHLQQAIENYQKAIKTYRNTDGDCSHRIATCYNNIGGIYQIQDRYSGALECHLKVLAIQEDYHYLADHPSIALAHHNIGIDYQSLGRYQCALGAF